MNKQIFIMSIFLGILIGFVLFALLLSNGIIIHKPSNESSAISLTNRMSKLDYSVEEMMEKEEKRFLSKQYYAYIIDQNSRFWREDKYKVLLLSVPKMEYYDSNNTDWLLIDGRAVCQDPNCIRFYMDQGAWISNDFLGNIKWQWAE